ncbi:hypothetical protein D3C80_1996160 [compost metagenome]
MLIAAINTNANAPYTSQACEALKPQLLIATASMPLMNIPAPGPANTAALNAGRP